MLRSACALPKKGTACTTHTHTHTHTHGAACCTTKSILCPKALQEPVTFLTGMTALTSINLCFNGSEVCRTSQAHTQAHTHTHTHSRRPCWREVCHTSQARDDPVCPQSTAHAEVLGSYIRDETSGCARENVEHAKTARNVAGQNGRQPKVVEEICRKNIVHHQLPPHITELELACPNTTTSLPCTGKTLSTTSGRPTQQDHELQC
jgi:hypothetical protein